MCLTVDKFQLHQHHRPFDDRSSAVPDHSKSYAKKDNVRMSKAKKSMQGNFFIPLYEK
jgi:hypothetical protein